MTLLNMTVGLVLIAVAAAETVLFFYFFTKYQKTLSIQALLGVIAGMVVWVAANGIAIFLGGDVTFIEKFAYLGGTLLTSSFLLFIFAFPYPKNHTIEALKYLPAVSVLFFGYLLFFTDTFLRKLSVDGISSSQIEQSGLSLWVWSFFIIVVWISALIELKRRYTEQIGETKERLRYLLIGVYISLFIGIISDILFPLFYKRTFAGLASLFSVVWLIFMIKAIRYREKEA